MTAPIPARRSGKTIVRDGRIHFGGGVPFWLPSMLLLAALAVGGCGGSEPEPAPPADTPEASEEPVAQKPESPKQEPAEKPLALPEPAPEQKPPRPESVLDWTAADYVSARVDRDPQLVDALAFLGEEGVGDEQTARLLTDLLTTVEAPLPDPIPQPKAEPPAPKPRRSGDDDDDDDDGDDDDDDYGDDDDDDDDDDSYDDDDDDDGEEDSGRPAAIMRDLGQWATGEGRKLDGESVAALMQLTQSDPGVATLIAGELWSPRFSALIAANLAGIGSLESGSQLLNLASTIPNDTARAGLVRALQAHRQEGPYGLFAAAALPEQGTVDPGFLAVLKTLPRQMPDKTGSGQDKPEQQWLQSSRTLLRYLCDSFRKAAEAAGGRSVELSEQDLGFKIHEDANIVAAYKLDWQQDVGPSLSGAAVSPMVIRYVGIRDNTRYSRMSGYYRRAVASGEVREIDNVTWIDSYRPGSEAGRMRSVDVLITRLPENTDPRSSQDEPLDVEILWIEINDPSGQQTASVGP